MSDNGQNEQPKPVEPQRIDLVPVSPHAPKHVMPVAWVGTPPVVDPKAVPQLPTPIFPNLELPKDPVTGLPPEQSKLGGNGDIWTKFEPHPNVPPPPPGIGRILIGVPLLSVTIEFLESFLKFWTELACSPNRKYEISFCFAYRRPVHMAEEYLVNTAINNRCTHILLMDDDIYDVTKADLDRLYFADKDVIGGVMYASKFPHAMCVFRRYDIAKKVIDMPADTSMFRLYEVPCMCPKCSVLQPAWDCPYCAACGQKLDLLIQQADLIPFPFTLIKMSVFDKIKKPWFHCTTKYPTDSWFSDRLIEVGMTEYAHMGVRLNHAGINDKTRPYYMQMGMELAKGKKAVVEITPEQMDLHQRLLVHKMMQTETQLRTRPLVIGERNTAVANKPVDGDFTLASHGVGR